MAVEIQRTTVTPDARGYLVVELNISDAPPEDASASFVLTLMTRLGPYEMPLLAHVQREAIKEANDHLRDLIQKMASQLQALSDPLEPGPALPRF